MDHSQPVLLANAGPNRRFASPPEGGILAAHQVGEFLDVRRSDVMDGSLCAGAWGFRLSRSGRPSLLGDGLRLQHWNTTGHYAMPACEQMGPFRTARRLPGWGSARPRQCARGRMRTAALVWFQCPPTGSQPSGLLPGSRTFWVEYFMKV